MEKCWARSLRGCCGKISAEHIISEGILPDDVTVYGLNWCGGKKKTIPKARFTAKILCRTHNTMLSELDAAARAFFQGITEVDRLRVVRGRIAGRAGRRWQRVTKVANGALIERWMLKTLVNLMTCGAYGQDNDWQPPAELVEIIFGRRSIGAGAGLSTPGKVNDEIAVGHKYDYSVLRRDGQAVGIVFVFMGFPFACTWDVPISEVEIPEGPFFPNKRTELLAHPAAIGFPEQNLELRISWPRGSQASSKEERQTARRHTTVSTAI